MLADYAHVKTHNHTEAYKLCSRVATSLENEMRQQWCVACAQANFSFV